MLIWGYLLALALVLVILTVLALDDADRSVLPDVFALLLEAVRKLNLAHFQLHGSRLGHLSGHLLIRVLAGNLRIRRTAGCCQAITSMKVDLLDVGAGLLSPRSVENACDPVLLVRRVVQLDLVL